MEPFHFLTGPKRKLNSFGNGDGGSYNTNVNQTLNYNDAQKAEDWLSSHYPEFVPGFLSFQLSDYEVFPKAMFENDILINFNGYKWWILIKEKFMYKLNEFKKKHSTASESEIKRYENLQSRPNQQFQQSRPPYQQFQQSRLPYQQYQQFQQSRPNQHFQQSQHQPHQSYWQNKSMQPGNAMPVKHNYPINQQAFGTPKNHSNTPYKPTPMSGISSIKTNLNFNEADITPRVYSYDSPFNNDRANPNNPFDINPINPNYDHPNYDHPNYDHPNYDHPNFDHPNYDHPNYDQNESEEDPPDRQDLQGPQENEEGKERKVKLGESGPATISHEMRASWLPVKQEELMA
ncbi:hypothetical protein NQ314_006305 [Rhamnusium bicolor]|uniref:Uncharacterized protein n=1 Tax=Rhamnusium bicolor TaxID=1586634 RepID=A0AAV8Z4Y7_9CUCU|nr:hypothetical protein NQ314_006305 [Rhamnusium bicolor]